MILYPPHPVVKILPKSLEKYEKTNKWIAQRKFNGTNILVHIDRDKNINLLTRHGTPPKLFNLTKDHKKEILSLNLEDKEYWINGELLDHKTKNKKYKGKIVLFDIIYLDKHLILTNQEDRLQILRNICRNPQFVENNSKIAIEVTDNIWLAEDWNSDFNFHYKEFLELDEIEGLILRKRKSLIDNFGSKPYDVSWMVKCRKPHAGGTYEY